MNTRFAGQRLIFSFCMVLVVCVWLFVWKQTTFEYNMEIYRISRESSVVGLAEQDVLLEFDKRKQGYIGAAMMSTLLIFGFCGILIRRNLTQLALEKRVREDAKRLQALQEMTGRLLTGSEGVDNLLQMILRDARLLADAPRGLIGMVDHKEHTFTIRYGIGLDAQRIGVQQSVTEGLMGEVISQGEPVFVADYSHYSGRLSENLLSTLKSILGIPLKIGNNVIGVLVVQWDQVNPEPKAEVLQALRQYANLASIALDRTHTHYEIQQLAYTDTLTGLPNRRSIYSRLNEEINREKGPSGAIFFIDLDNLKLVNDTCGHDYGDILIVEASRHIAQVAGQDSFVGRLAGDEFVVFKSNCVERQDIEKVADTLIEALDRQCDWQGSLLRVSATIGIAIFPQDGSTVEEIIKNADAALYVAKNKGKSSWKFYDAILQQNMLEKMLLSSSLHHALSRGELYVCYQPVMNPQSSLLAFEALLRWKSPEHGLVPPAQFIPVAEQNGQIHLIGAWVLQEACRFAKKLADLGYGSLRVEVNVSARQLEKLDFITTVIEAIDAAGIKPNQLGLEITESVFMESVEDNAAKLKQLQSLGVNISLDDFGEGYSSLIKLLQLPVNALKISRSLISMLGTDPQQIRFITSIVDMAHALGLAVVAEGVETEQQFLQVTDSRCDKIQGYFFHRPMLTEDALRLVKLDNIVSK